jgi:hypothetical protein
MDRRSLTVLKLDKRLIRRRGWISAEELERELEALPDVADKIAEPDPEPPEEESAP